MTDEQLEHVAIRSQMARAVDAHLQWLDARAKWLRKEYLNGGNFEHLSAREAECLLAAERLKELLPSADDRSIPCSKTRA